MENKIKLVVYNENTLGYILPEKPKYVQVLHASVLRGANHTIEPTSFYIHKSSKVRLATEQDFNDYRVSMEGFKNNPEYLHN